MRLESRNRSGVSKATGLLLAGILLAGFIPPSVAQDQDDSSETAESSSTSSNRSRSSVARRLSRIDQRLRRIERYLGIGRDTDEEVNLRARIATVERQIARLQRTKQDTPQGVISKNRRVKRRRYKRVKVRPGSPADRAGRVAAEATRNTRSTVKKGVEQAGKTARDAQGETRKQTGKIRKGVESGAKQAQDTLKNLIPGN